MDTEQFMKYLRAKISEVGNQRAFAQLYGISQPYLSGVVNGKVPPSKEFLHGLGLERVIMYRPIDDPGIAHDVFSGNGFVETETDKVMSRQEDYGKQAANQTQGL